MEFEEWWEKNKLRFWEMIDPMKPLEGAKKIAEEVWNLVRIVKVND